MLDFSSGKNRFVRLDQVSKDYINKIEIMTNEDPFYPIYHVAPKCGLLNDPNGLSFYNDEHHIFYQWFPLGPVHGLKHWYHVSTKDFIHFKDYGIAMYPDELYDSHGCFSGSALKAEDKLYLFYTGNKMIKENIFEPFQCYATLDRDNKVVKHGVLVERDKEKFTGNFRDPIVFERQNHYYMLIGGETVTGKGGLAIYIGESPKHFTYLGKVDVGLSSFGYMWECPNYYETEEKGVLIFSPQGISSDNKYDFKNVFSVVYIVGNKIDVTDLSFINEGYFELDKGFDFYAPQTYLDEQGRRILIGWLGNSKSEYPTDKNMWAHMLTIPRAISIHGDKIRQEPLEELKALRVYSEQLTESTKLTSTSFEIDCEIGEVFQIEISNDEGDKLIFSSDGKEYCLDRSQTTYVYAEKFGTKRFALRKKYLNQQLRMFVDASSIEIFCDEGETVFTSRFFIKDMEKISVSGLNGTIHYLSKIILDK